jgi:uncharacterized Tic20 family protein
MPATRLGRSRWLVWNLMPELVADILGPVHGYKKITASRRTVDRQTSVGNVSDLLFQLGCCIWIFQESIVFILLTKLVSIADRCHDKRKDII